MFSFDSHYGGLTPWLGLGCWRQASNVYAEGSYIAFQLTGKWPTRSSIGSLKIPFAKMFAVWCRPTSFMPLVKMNHRH